MVGIWARSQEAIGMVVSWRLFGCLSQVVWHRLCFRSPFCFTAGSVRVDQLTTKIKSWIYIDPQPSNSHHQDNIWFFKIWDLKLNLHLLLLVGRGGGGDTFAFWPPCWASQSFGANERRTTTKQSIRFGNICSNYMCLIMEQEIRVRPMYSMSKITHVSSSRCIMHLG